MSTDLSNIPLSSLRTAQRNNEGSPDRSGSAPLAHYPHDHGYGNPHFYEGIDPGNQGAASTEQREAGAHRPHQPHPSSTWQINDPDDSRDTQDSEFKAPRPPFASQNTGGHSRASSIASSADDTDDFDWDTSDDDDDKEIDAQGNIKIRAKRGRRVYLFCMRLARPVRIALMGAFFSILCLVPLFVVLFGIDRSNSARPHVQSFSIWLAIISASSAGTFILLDFLPPLILRLAIAVYGRAPEVFKTYIEVAMSTILYVKLVLCVAWAWISLGGILAAIWTGSTGSRPAYWTWVFRVIKALFATSVILLAEKFALHVVAVNFHKTAVKDRLEENQKALRYLDKLHESKYLNEGSRGTKHASGAWGNRFGFAGSRPVSPGPNNLGGGRATKDGLGGYFPPDASGGMDPVAMAAMSEKPQGSSSHHHGFSMHHHSHSQSEERLRKVKADRKANFANQLQDALATATMKDSKLYKQHSYGSQKSARKLAKKLFHNLGNHRKTLVAEDFIPYFKSEEQAREAFSLFDKDNNGDIEKSEMREAVQRIYRERRALATSLKDMNSALQKLDMVLMFLGLIIVIFIWLLIFSPTSTVSNLVPVSTVVVAFSFVFGNSAKNIFESMIFIFATHPYDVGDLVCIDDTWMFVKEFGMISTVFNTTVNQIVVAPNALLASSKYIHNARRSGNQWEVTNVQMGFDTALQTIDEFRRRLRAYVKENDREWGGGLDVNYSSITNQNSVELTIAMEHKGNWQDWGARWNRRTKLMRQVKLVAEQLGIEYSLPPQPVTYHARGGPGPRSAGPRISGGPGGPGGVTGAQPGAGGQAGTAGGALPGLAMGGVGQGYGLNTEKTTT